MTTTADEPLLAKAQNGSASDDMARDGPVGPSCGAGAQDTRAAFIRRWSGWASLVLETLPLPYPLTVALLGVAAVGEQMLEYWVEDPSFGSLASMGIARGFVLPLLIVYILTHLRILKRATVDALMSLRDAVLVDDDEYEECVRRMLCASQLVEWMLLAASAVLVLVVFVGLGADLLNANRGLPQQLPAAALILLMYTLLGWLLLSLVYTSIRQARELRRLAHRPLAVNVFDPANLLPFGRLAIVQSLPVVGVLLIPMVLFGMPTSGGYLVVAVSAISLLALFAPLWGVHEQIDKAKEAALDAIYRQLQDVCDALMVDLSIEISNLTTLADRTDVMLKLRETIQQSSNWPFKDSAAVARAIAAVTSPLVYFILNELIRAYLLPVLEGGGMP